MSDNLDDFLNALGIAPQEGAALTTTSVDNPTEEHSITVPQEEPETQNLSAQDFDDILEDFGFSPPQDTEAEELDEDEELEELSERESAEVEALLNEIAEGERDLDAEEDADWQERIASGEIREIPPEDDIAHLSLVRQPQQEELQSGEPLLAPNSPTLLMDESTTRFSGAEWFNEIQKKSIIFGGIGGIGSNCCFQIARMHPAAMFLYDDDRVETVNMAGQLFSRDDVGKTKVDAIADMITAYTNAQNIYAINDRFTEYTAEAGDIMMCGFDNMEARKTFFLAWQNHVGHKPEEERKNCLFLDGRLSIDTLQVFCLTGDDTVNMERYSKEFLFSDADADETVCSMKQTTYLACMIGSIMTNLFTNWCANNLDPIIPYDLPFFTEYDAQNMIFKTVK